MGVFANCAPAGLSHLPRAGVKGIMHLERGNAMARALVWLRNDLRVGEGFGRRRLHGARQAASVGPRHAELGDIEKDVAEAGWGEGGQSGTRGSRVAFGLGHCGFERSVAGENGEDRFKFGIA